MKNTMAIDPGLQGTGYAIWVAGKRAKPIMPVDVGVLYGPRGEEWMPRADRIAVQISDLVQQYEVKRIICEEMESYNTAKSSMAWKGDLQRTVFLIGMIHGMTRLRVKRFILVPPREWKGQLPKSVTIHRVREALGARACIDLDIKTHAWDAVGIGLW